MELWTTDIHCKAPVWHGKTPQPWLQRTHRRPPLKEGQEIGLCSKLEKRMERWGEEGREVGDWRLAKVGGGAHKQGPLRGTVQVPQSWRCLWKRRKRDLGRDSYRARLKRPAFLFSLLKWASRATGCVTDGSDPCEQQAEQRGTQNTPRRGLQVRVGEPADWR